MKIWSEPYDICKLELKPTEFCFVQYLPIKMAGQDSVRIPQNLLWVDKMFKKVECYAPPLKGDYVYLTVKYGWHSNTSPQNRRGWHIDGFGTDDDNYIWYDSHPTECAIGNFDISKDHCESMKQMAEQVEQIKEFPNKHVIYLGNTDVHRVSEKPFEGIRAFVKLSVSRHKYALEGNAHNYLFDYAWEMQPRKQERNCPVGGKV